MAIIQPLPSRVGEAPKIDGPNPHAQRSQIAPRRLQERLHDRAVALTHVIPGASGVSVPGARAFHLDPEAAKGPREAFQVGTEFAHIHPPYDGSLHMTLPPDVASDAYARGWGVPHPMSGTPLIFGPRDDAELEVIWTLLNASYGYAIGDDDSPGSGLPS